MQLFRKINEEGQSIVLIAAAFLGLLAFVGLATDVGLAFVRSSEFSKAVDAAAQAAVLELSPSPDAAEQTDELDRAQRRAEQFLTANGWPTATLTVFENSLSISRRGIMPQYTLTVTWPVPVFFLRIIGIEGFPITHSATAAFFAQNEITTPTGGTQGQVKLGNQFIFGPDACAREGDPVSPLRSTPPNNPNEDYPFFGGVYKYRIRIPTNYTTNVGNILRVELFDPDSVNREFGNIVNFTHSNACANVLSCNALIDPLEVICDVGRPDERCVVRTGESLTIAFNNPLWLRRVDENWDDSCNRIINNGENNMITKFTLHYIDEFGARTEVSSYIDDNANADSTDMRWVSPCEAGLGCFVPTESGFFEVDISAIPLGTDGSRSLYLDVSSPAGSAKNSWDLWAGPPQSFYTGRGLAPLEQNVNLRNLQIANDPSDYSNKGVVISALGRMPVNHFIDGEPITMKLVKLGSSQDEQAVYATLFDYDDMEGGVNTLQPPADLRFTLDTVATEPPQFDPGSSIFHFNRCSTVVDNPSSTPNGSCIATDIQPMETTCDNSQNCDNQWMMPQLSIVLQEGLVFPGGVLQVTYDPHGDAHVWEFAGSQGNPFLTK